MAHHIRTTDDLNQNLSLKPREAVAAAPVDPDQTVADVDRINRDGYLIIENVLSQSQLDAIRAAAPPLLDHCGRNNFEGLKTQRVYNVLAKTRAIDDLTIHPRVTALLDQLFLPNYLLSQAQIINILPGEEAQLLHADDAFYRIPRPRPPLGIASIWAIDDFTAENGATTIIPASHTWPDDRHADPADAVPAVMPAGSVVVFLGTTWHGGGANRTDRPRLAVTCQYCEPWLRQQENFFLAVPPQLVSQLHERLQSLIGYSIYPPFMGMVDGRHPLRHLEQSAGD